MVRMIRTLGRLSLRPNRLTYNSLYVNSHAWSQLRSSSTIPEKTSTDYWRTIYSLPLVRLASAFNRLKIYQTFIVFGGTPVTMVLEQAGHLSANTGNIFGLVGVSGIITLTLGSYAVRNLVGFIYINEMENKIKLAYVDFWGRRQHAVIDLDDLIPHWERSSRFNFYQPIRLHSDSRTKYKLLQRFGVITEPETFVGLFGE